jgi:hypothetical protein
LHFGSFVHFHVVVPDGVFTRAGVTFHEERAPSRAEVAAHHDVEPRVGARKMSIKKADERKAPGAQEPSAPGERREGREVLGRWQQET